MFPLVKTTHRLGSTFTRSLSGCICIGNLYGFVSKCCAGTVVPYHLIGNVENKQIPVPLYLTGKEKYNLGGFNVM